MRNRLPVDPNGYAGVRRTASVAFWPGKTRLFPRIQRNFEPMQRQLESWRQARSPKPQAKLIFYSAFVDGELDAPKSLLPEIHRPYFEPQYPEFSPRTMWS